MEKEKKKKLNLKPSARDRRRYFIVNASPELVMKAILDYIGVLGLSNSSYEPVMSGNTVIHSCLAESLENVRASLAFANIEIKKVSGTIKSLKK